MAASFTTVGLDGAVATCKAGLAANHPNATPSERRAYINGYAEAAAEHIDDTADPTLADLKTMMATPSKFLAAMDLQATLDAKVADDTAKDAAEAAASAARTTAITAAENAINTFVP